MQMMQGSPPESTQKLTFDVPKANAGDSDKAIIDKG